MPNGDTMISERIVPGSRLVIQNKDFPADLIVLGIHDFDIILGMNWLSRHRATLDCYKKEVRLVRPEEPGMIFRGIKREITPSLINAMTASKMLRKGCHVATPGTGQTSLADPSRNPGDALLSLNHSKSYLC